MPSPVGHALGGIAAGWLLERMPEPGARHPPAHRATLAFALLGMTPDLDLLLPVHRGPTHSVGAAVLVGSLIWLSVRTRMWHPARFAIACAAAYGSHILLDWLGEDTWAPFGVVALWPVSATYFESPWHVFMAVSRRVAQPAVFWRTNIAALTRELLVLLPVVLAIGYLKGRRKSRHRSGYS